MNPERARRLVAEAIGTAMLLAAAGIRPIDVPAFIVAQVAGAAAATLLFRWLVPALPRTAQLVVVPQSEPSTS